HTVIPLAAMSDAGEILSLLVATRVQTLPNLFAAVSSRSVLYAEPLCLDSPESVESLAELIATHDQNLKRRVLFAEVRPLYESGSERLALERSGYQYLDYLNYVIDTTEPVENIWRRVHDSAKSYVRKCEKRGFTLRHLDGPESVDILY